MAFPLIGELRHRITFQIPVVQDDGYGGEEKIWQDVFTVWASIKPVSGREYYEAMAIQNEITHRIKVRYRSDITTDMRIAHGDRIYEIEAVIDIDSRHKYLEILCRE